MRKHFIDYQRTRIIREYTLLVTSMEAPFDIKGSVKMQMFNFYDVALYYKIIKSNKSNIAQVALW